ncbi:hypothetical protein [Litorihabitans aurantiacus]|uniref:Uncharacterized protein n=1 Tax=Litorihabitans aurantiacus TaxID=1930061 RepID=A0AA37XFJ5_9MICO|nr:hypothetical protein [Litorihabitans aurantiacus]GMA32077.1 hypothetical protein GCM10025875_20690 [Litorihabitans aurantiacus]
MFRPVLGVGGDDAAPVAVDLEPGRPWLVCGPPESGRSTVLAAVAAQATGPVLRVGADEAPPSSASLAGLAAGTLVLVDDAEQLDAATAEALVAVLAQHRGVVATSTAAVQTAYRGVLATVAQARTVVALGGALPPHCAHARPACDPAGGAGRAVVVIGTAASALQVAHP